MDPLTLMLGLLAVVFGLTTMMFWRRAADLEERVRELEGKLTDTLPAPKEVLKADAPAPREEPAEPPPAAESADEAEEEEAAKASSDEEEEEDEDEDEDEDDEEEEAEQEEAKQEPEPEPAKAEPEPEPEEEKVEEAPKAAAPAPEPEPPKPAEPDPLRIEALKVVNEAFELARYLDFDAIVEKPSTYRVTVPITAANGPALRYLKDGMFGCLKQVRVEGSSAILHVDTSKGPP